MRCGPITVIDRTTPMADKDYWCECDLHEPHKIKKNDIYVRLIYDNHLTREKFLTVHLCPRCDEELGKDD